MKNALLMKIEASYSLNFLVYIQNLFLNRYQNKDEWKFPYLPSRGEFQEDFEMRYREVWSEVARRISENPTNDLGIFIDEKSLFYQRLFAQSEDTLKEYNDIYHSFNVWWQSMAGQFAVESSISEQGQTIYTQLAECLLEKGITPQKELTLSLLYDDCLLAQLDLPPYFAVVSIRDCLVDKELIDKLTEAFFTK
ncbi:hypothetical protein M3212_05330 [Alkalihalobacillus oceani]|uniref:hypothetical protein n=1 Tax=Halalkalibacter oceani TaxID=1653776 RepID=UPI0020410451|nr:hypothetical protein [Halalkalibacter oceani]MCM3760211.1 hypothetical protein [Halalkalibacter oceani]